MTFFTENLYPSIFFGAIFLAVTLWWLITKIVDRAAAKSKTVVTVAPAVVPSATEIASKLAALLARSLAQDISAATVAETLRLKQELADLQKKMQWVPIVFRLSRTSTCGKHQISTHCEKPALVLLWLDRNTGQLIPNGKIFVETTYLGRDLRDMGCDESVKPPSMSWCEMPWTPIDGHRNSIVIEGVTHKGIGYPIEVQPLLKEAA